MVLPYITFSVALNVSPSVNELNCELLSALKYVTYKVIFSTSPPSVRAINFTTA